MHSLIQRNCNRRISRSKIWTSAPVPALGHKTQHTPSRPPHMTMVLHPSIYNLPCWRQLDFGHGHGKESRGLADLQSWWKCRSYQAWLDSTQPEIKKNDKIRNKTRRFLIYYCQTSITITWPNNMGMWTPLLWILQDMHMIRTYLDNFYRKTCNRKLYQFNKHSKFHCNLFS